MELLEIVEAQHGVVGRWQVRALGLSRSKLLRRLLAGEWVAVSPRVLRRAGAPTTPVQRIMAAVLDAGPGAVASHASAAWLWRIPGFVVAPRPEVSRLRATNGVDDSLGVVHRPRLLPADQVGAVDGVPVTRPERTLCDLAARLDPLRLERAVDSALAGRIADLARLWLTFADLSATGRPGRTALRQILADRPPGYIAPESELEARFAALVGAGGFDPPERQVDVGAADWVGRVDFLFRRARLVVEVDGRLTHTELCDRRVDAARDAALRASGFDLRRFGWSDVTLYPQRTLATLRRALSATSAPAAGPPAPDWHLDRAVSGAGPVPVPGPKLS